MIFSFLDFNFTCKPLLMHNEVDTRLCSFNVFCWLPLCVCDSANSLPFGEEKGE